MATSGLSRPFRYVFIANVAESFARLLSAGPDSLEKRLRIAHETSLSQRALFWGGDDKVVITPTPIPHEMLLAAKKSLGWSNIFTLAPSERPLMLSRAIRDDIHLYTSLCEIIQESSTVSLSAYSSTDGFCDLVRELLKQSSGFHASEIPIDSSRPIREYLDSKAGFREIALDEFSSGSVKLPEGHICASAIVATNAACIFLAKKQSCVIKANQGESGWGTLILKHDKIPVDAASYISSQLGSDLVWESTPLIVEAFVEPALDLETAFPSAEVYVGADGPYLIYLCLQLISPVGEFKGVLLGNLGLDDEISDKIGSAALKLGERYFREGYRGYFDIDFVIDKNGHIFALETNMRRTGGTHVYDMAQELARTGRKPKCLVSDDQVRYSDQSMSANQLFEQVNGLLFPIGQQDHGIVITHVSDEIPVFGYVAIGSNTDDIRNLQCALYKSLALP